jgi:sugar phosphate isomerase/epimerase
MSQALDHLTIALAAKWDVFSGRDDCIVAHGFAAEYTLHPQRLDLLPAQVDPLLEAGVPVRYHGFFPEHEIGHADPLVAERAMHVQETVLAAIKGRGEQVITLHIGLSPHIPLNMDRAVENLSRLVAHGRELGITLCLENLRRGATSDPKTVTAWARASGAMITLDVGHAVSCRHVQDGKLTPVDFVEAFADRLLEVHMYEREEDRHYPPTDMTTLGPIVDALLATSCTWWTIELDSCAEAVTTRALLLDYLTCC